MLNTKDLIKLTKDFVSINSISTTKNKTGEFNENTFASYLKKICKQYNLPTTFIKTPDGRYALSVLLKGKSKKTIVLIAHHDTVGVDDMEGLNPFTIDKNTQHFQDSNRYLYGRGAGDMKSGIAVGIAVLEELNKQELETNIIFISAPDEENESSGILAAIDYLKSLQEKEGYEYLGVINLDSGLQDELHPERKVVELAGAIGKLLPCFYVVGKSSHASDPFEGISSTTMSSNLLQELDGNVTYCDTNKLTKRLSPPPVCLKYVDLKSEYDTQLPMRSFLYFNYHMYGETPKQVLAKMKNAAKKSLKISLQNNERKYREFCSMQTKRAKKRDWEKNIQVFTYDEILAKAKKQNPRIEEELQTILDTSQFSDAREQNLQLVEHITKVAAISVPYIVCFFSKPYYPSSYSENKFTKSIEKIIKKFALKNNLLIDISKYSEGISDTNYMQINKEKVEDIKTYMENNPLAKKQGDINIDTLASISMPIACIGPSAFHPHQRNEKVEIAYTFDKYPELLLTIITTLQKLFL